MLTPRPLPRFLALLAGAPLFFLPGPVRARDLANIDISYRGGPLIQHVKVVTLFWGRGWKGTREPEYFNNFFKTLFADGRYLANLSQYSAGGYTIGNGELLASMIDEVPPSGTMTDAQIRAEIQSQLAAGNLPPADSDTLYVIFPPPNVLVKDRHDADSAHDFSGYHDFASEGSFAYAVIPFEDAADMTIAASHELAEAVTDPEPSRYTLGWYDDQNGEIGDIPVTMLDLNQIGMDGFTDHLKAPDGTDYVVQKVWSNADSLPVAFAN